jgi:ribosomal protein S18 acetylase RimI-like enzyme
MIRIERAGLEHGDELVELFEAYRAFYRCELVADAARSYLATRLANGESTVFLAWQERDGGRQAVGFTQLYPGWASLKLAPSWVLYDLYVAPAARRLGVARLLLERAIRHARGSGAKVVVLETAIDNAPAQALYESTGWKRDTDFYTYYYDL